MAGKEAVLIFMNGSKVTEGAGSACTSVDGSISVTRGFRPVSSIFTAECISLSDALDVVANSERLCSVFSDSLSTLQALERTKVGARTNPYVLEIKSKRKGIEIGRNLFKLDLVGFLIMIVF